MGLFELVERLEEQKEEGSEGVRHLVLVDSLDVQGSNTCVDTLYPHSSDPGVFDDPIIISNTGHSTKSALVFQRSHLNCRPSLTYEKENVDKVFTINLKHPTSSIKRQAFIFSSEDEWT